MAAIFSRNRQLDQILVAKETIGEVKKCKQLNAIARDCHFSKTFGLFETSLYGRKSQPMRKDQNLKA